MMGNYDAGYDTGYNEGYEAGHGAGQAGADEAALRIEALALACSFAQDCLQNGGPGTRVSDTHIAATAEVFLAFLTGEGTKKDGAV